MSSIRVALASSDGKVINQHFGHAERFYIVGLEDGAYYFLESRDVAAACQEQEHDESSFDATLQILDDCAAIFVSKIGPGAAAYLLGQGKRVFEAPGIIDDVLNYVLQKNILAEGGDNL
jgi:predicted Fe-Mo cluster-binding NifX family protein